ncbi:MAG: oxidoreductase [Chloroflexi bacterium]|nr:oxidoreductase [Chloroflexota bacterium]
MVDKPKVAVLWLGGCGGCDETVVDLNEVILNVVGAVDLVLWPVALDYKYHDIEKMKDGEIALTILNGNIRNSDHTEMAKLLRQKSQLVIAFGACACFGGTPALANLKTREEIFNWVYQDAPTVTNSKRIRPEPNCKVDGRELTLPEFYEHVYSVDQVIDVDYYLPGCPPPPYLVMQAISAVLEGKLPRKGSTLAPHKALCDDCPRNATKPVRLAIKKFKRIHEVEADPNSCFLAQGILCTGIVTRTGCGESCININLPCRGCFGPVDGIEDAGGKFISALASIMDGNNEDDIKEIVSQITDTTGYLYRFTLPVSILGKRGLQQV